MSIKINVITDFVGDGITKARKQFAQLEGAGAKAGFVVKKAMLPATAALGGLGAMAKDVIGIASDLGESQSKVNVIFGEGAKDVEAFSKQAAKSMGQSRRAVLQAAGTFGTFGKAAGLGGKDLAKFSNDFTKLAGDLASFNNTSPEEAVEAIGAALRGEAEPMRRFGVLLNDATLKAEAMALGIYDGSGALTDQQKILAAQSAIYKQTGDAQGDFERTSDGLANSQRILSASIDDTKASIGDALLPIVEEVIPYLKDFADWARDNPGTFKTIAAAIGAIALSVMLLNFAMALNPIGLIVIGVGLLITGLALAYQRFESVRTIVDFLFQALKLGINNAINNFRTMLNIVKAVFNGIGSAWNNTFGKINFTIPDIRGLPGRGTKIQFPKIPALADGGVVTGPTLALIGEAGPEAVVPLDRMGSMGGGDVNIYVQGADPNAVVDALRTYMFRNGSVPIRVS
jgi:hypothetical protein